jgi:hypothetical protein
MTKYLRISSHIRKPFLIYDLASDSIIFFYQCVRILQLFINKSLIELQKSSRNNLSCGMLRSNPFLCHWIQNTYWKDRFKINKNTHWNSDKELIFMKSITQNKSKHGKNIIYQPGYGWILNRQMVHINADPGQQMMQISGSRASKECWWARIQR